MKSVKLNASLNDRVTKMPNLALNKTQKDSSFNGFTNPMQDLEPSSYKHSMQLESLTPLHASPKRRLPAKVFNQTTTTAFTGSLLPQQLIMTPSTSL